MRGQAQIRRILVVDDEKVIRELFRRILRGREYEVDSACNGRQALDKIRSEQYDIMFLDILMPELNGIEVLRAMKEIKSRIPIIIMMSGYGAANQLEAVRALGASGCINKPFNIEDIWSILGMLQKQS